MKTIVLSAPAIDPSALLLAKAQLRIEPAFTDDDDYITALIRVALDRCENYCNRFFSIQDIKILFQGEVPLVVDLPYFELTVTSITYTDTNNALQTLAPSNYIVDAVNQTITFSNSINSLNYQIFATTSAPAVAAAVTQAAALMITDMYELRTETVIGASIAENPAVKALLYPYRESLGI
jgi:hypothetical protein